MARPTEGEARLRVKLVEIVAATPWLMRALRAVRSVGPPLAWVGAGAVRNTVWDSLHGCSRRTVADVDVAFFESSDLSRATDALYQRRLADLEPALSWDVVNQASVHLWYEQTFGEATLPLRSVEDGIATWPETATAVGVRLDDAGHIQVLAPYGLSDLFECVVRRSPRASAEQFRARVEAKRYAARWPKVRVVWE